MTVRPVRTALLLLTACLACGKRARESATSQAAEDIVATLAAYLEAARAGTAEAVPESLLACDVDWDAETGRALAAYRALDTEVYADTALARAQVITVADIVTPDTGTFRIVVPYVRVDTLSWQLVKHGGRWGICGYSRQGVGFARLRYLPSGTVWQGGATLESVLHAADSVALERM